IGPVHYCLYDAAAEKCDQPKPHHQIPSTSGSSGSPNDSCTLRSIASGIRDELFANDDGRSPLAVVFQGDVSSKRTALCDQFVRQLLLHKDRGRARTAGRRSCDALFDAVNTVVTPMVTLTDGRCSVGRVLEMHHRRDIYTFSKVGISLVRTV